MKKRRRVLGDDDVFFAHSRTGKTMTVLADYLRQCGASDDKIKQVIEQIEGGGDMAEIIDMNPGEMTKEEAELATLRAEVRDLRLELESLTLRYDGMQDMARMNAAASILPALLHRGNAPKLAVERAVELSDLLITMYEDRIEGKIRRHMELMQEAQANEGGEQPEPEGAPN